MIYRKVVQIMADLEKRDIRLQIFITQSMDDKLEDIAELMGMSKNELCRMAIGQLALGYNTTVDILKNSAKEEMSKGGK